MNKQQNKTGLQLSDWKLWFRLGTIGFLLVLCCKAEAQQLQFANPNAAEDASFSQQSAADKPEAKLLIPIGEEKPAIEPSLPLLLTPAQKVNGKKVINPKPSSKPEIKKPAVKNPLPKVIPKPVIPLNAIPVPANKTVKEVPKPKVAPLPKVAPKPTVVEKKKQYVPHPTLLPQHHSTQQWSVLITPGKSSHPRGDSTPTLTTFQLDPLTGDVVAPPQVQRLSSEELHEHQTESQSGSAKRSVNAVQYEKIYQAIPYNRAEYLANPSYRHEATMEILFGKMRPTVIHKNQMPSRVYSQPQLNEASPRRYAPAMPYGYYPGYNSYGYYRSLYSAYRNYPGYYGNRYGRYGYPGYGYGYGHRYGYPYSY